MMTSSIMMLIVTFARKLKEDNSKRLDSKGKGYGEGHERDRQGIKLILRSYRLTKYLI
jgi:hypothetical protein